MHFLWNAIILPLLSSIRARTIVEIGTADGQHTTHLADYVSGIQGMVHTIDVKRSEPLDALLHTYVNHIRFYEEKSLTALPKITGYDTVLIDGDHNWYTVYNELKTIYEHTTPQLFPLVLIHDVSWPYARRDLYYDPSTIPKAYLHPYGKGGVIPGTNTLNDNGLNANLYHSLQENLPRCGVLSAVEDFLAEHSSELQLQIIPGMHGIGILTSHALLERYPELRNTLQSYCTPPAIATVIQAMENCRLYSATKRQYYENKSIRLQQLYDETMRKSENPKDVAHIQQLQKANSELIQLLQSTRADMQKERDEFANAMQKQLHNTQVAIAVERKKNKTLQTLQQKLQAQLQYMEQTKSWRWTSFLRRAATYAQSLRTEKKVSAVCLRPGTVVKQTQSSGSTARISAASAAAYRAVCNAVQTPDALPGTPLNRQPLVSYVLCVDGTNEQSLRRTLNSLSQQTYTHWELHIWHLKNNTLVPSVAAEYQDRYPGVIHCHATRKCVVSLRTVFANTTGILLLSVHENWLLSSCALETLVRVHNQDATHYNAYITPHMTADLTGIPTQLHALDVTKRAWRKRVRVCMFPRSALHELVESNSSLPFSKTALLLRALSCTSETVYVHDKAVCTVFA